MSILHVVYRVHDPGTRDEQWASYSFPDGIYVERANLDEVRSEFRAAVAGLSTEGGEHSPIEHLERPLAPGAYVRVAVDQRSLDREEVAQIMHSSLSVPAQFDNFRARMPMAATGDAVMIACVPEDRLDWVFEQMTDHAAVGICALGTETSGHRLVWWSFLVGGTVEDVDSTAVETLAGAGLSAGSTVAEFMRADAAPTGRWILANAS